MSPFFTSFRDKLSRKSSKSASSPGDQSEPYFTSTAPATRRPARRGMNAFSTPSSSEAPPTYQDAVRSPAYAPASGSARVSAPRVAASIADDEFAFLGKFDTKFLIDDSGSMAGHSWNQCRSALEAVVNKCVEYDKDGVDIHFLNHADEVAHMNIKDGDEVLQIFDSVRPGGGTPTGQRLSEILWEYFLNFGERARPGQVKPLNIIVVTDGAPEDDPASIIKKYAKRLDKLDADPWQLGIQFVQVGHEPGATTFLEYLDNELGTAKKGREREFREREFRDIVDTEPANGPSEALTDTKILNIVLGAVNRRIDNRSK